MYNVRLARTRNFAIAGRSRSASHKTTSCRIRQ